MPVNQYIDHDGIAIASGRAVKYSHINKFGFNDTVGTSWEPIQVGSANFTYPTTAAVASAVSTSSNDTSAGTGARTLSIQGLDENYNQYTETISLNGQSAVTTTGTFIRVFRARVETAGSGAASAGNITISVGGNTLATIDNDYDNQTLQAAYTIPARHRGYLIRMQATSTKDNKAAMVGMFAKPNGTDTVFTVKQLIEVYRNSVVVDFPIPLEFDEKTDLELRGLNLNSGNVSIGGTFDLILVKK